MSALFNVASVKVLCEPQVSRWKRGGAGPPAPQAGLCLLWFRTCAVSLGPGATGKCAPECLARNMTCGMALGEQPRPLFLTPIFRCKCRVTEEGEWGGARRRPAAAGTHVGASAKREPLRAVFDLQKHHVFHGRTGQRGLTFDFWSCLLS